MVITDQLREVLTKLGTEERQLSWLERKDQRVKGAITIEMPIDQHEAVMEQLRKIPYYKFEKVDGITGKPKKKSGDRAAKTAAPLRRPSRAKPKRPRDRSRT